MNNNKIVRLDTRVIQRIINKHINKDDTLDKIKDDICDFALSKLKHQDIRTILKQINKTTSAIEYMQAAVNNEGVGYFPKKHLDIQPGKVITYELFNLLIRGSLKHDLETIVAHRRVHFGNNNKKYNLPFFSFSINFTTHAWQLQNFIKNLSISDLISYVLKKDTIIDINQQKLRTRIIHCIFTKSKRLNLSNCNLNSIPRNILRLFPHIEELDLRDNNIHEIIDSINSDIGLTLKVIENRLTDLKDLYIDQ